ncbi:MAG: DUF6350 family protein [Bowdeniella nasicola]|nr:DUF6350 family protein [Bowdeniella nasicola]
MTTSFSASRLPSGWLRAFFAALHAVVLVWLLTAASFTMTYAATASSPYLGAATWQTAVGVATDAFLLGYGLPIPTSIGTLTLIPTLLAVLTVVLSSAGQRYFAVVGLRYLPYVAAGGFVAIILIGLFSGRGFTVLLPAVIAAVLCMGGAIANVGAAGRRLTSGEYSGPVAKKIRRTLALLPQWVRTGFARARVCLWWLLALATSGFLIAVTWAFSRVSEMTSQLSNSLLDTIALWLAQLAYLPTYIVWAGGYLTGAGYHIGAATYQVGHDPVGILPSIPILLAGPLTRWSAWLITGVVTMMGALAAWYTRRDDAASLLSHLGAAVSTGSALVAITTLAAWASGGGVTPGPLAHCGTRVVPMALATTITVALPYLLISVVLHRETLAWARVKISQAHEKINQARENRAISRSAAAQSAEQNPHSTAVDPEE